MMPSIYHGSAAEEWLVLSKAWIILLPVTTARSETSHTPVATLIGGEYERGSRYSNWRPHGSGDWLLLYTVDGAGRIGLPAHRAHRLAKGEILLYAPGARQDYGTDPASGRWHLLWAHFQPRPHWRVWLHWPEIAPQTGCVSLGPAEAREAVPAALRRMIALSRRPIPHATDFACNALEEVLLWVRAATDDTLWGKVDARIRKSMDYLAAELDRPFRLDEAARHCGLSVSRFSHLFKTELGVSPQAYSEELRLNRARQLLKHTSLSLREIANATGFSDAFYFSKRFRRAAGKSPSAWRATEIDERARRSS